MWITNVAIPDIAKEMGNNFSNGGGWLINLSKQLVEMENIELCIVFPIDNKSEITSGIVNNIKYFGVPLKKASTDFDGQKILLFRDIISEIQPDVVHIWGTEYIHSYYAINACSELGIINRAIVSIQGMVSVLERHYYAFIDSSIIKRYTLKEIVMRSNLRTQRDDFIKRGKYEIETIKLAKNVIGRTDWDKACVYQINPNIKYHFCNETLRPIFYENSWNLDTCEKYSIFVSQSHYPIKGLHILLEAMPLILNNFPNARIYTTGKNLLDRSFKARLRDTTYDKYIKNLVNKYELNNHINFLGALSEEAMCERFCKSHVFVSASSIENSSNSVGEAMILGVPVVSSDVGGIKNLLNHGDEGFIYQADAPYMLAYYICKIFSDNKLALDLSTQAKLHATNTHSRELNLNTLLETYQNIQANI